MHKTDSILFETAGLVGTVNSITDQSFVGWIRLYNLTFIVGLAISFFVFWGLNLVFPPPGLGEESPFVEDEVLYGVGHEKPNNDIETPGLVADKHTVQATVSA